MRLPFAHAGELVLGTRGRFFLPERFRPTFALSRDELCQHGHIIGSSGTGKSMFQADLVRALLRLGYPVILIDPHGDLARLVLALLLESGFFSTPDAYERLLYLDFAAADAANRYLPMNPLARKGRSSDIASDVKDAFHRAFPELGEGTPTFDTLLPDAVQLLVHNALPLTALYSVFMNDTLRQQLLAREADPFLIESWELYNRLRTPSDKMQYAGSVLRRARQITFTETLRYGLAQASMALDFTRIITRQQSVLINLAVPNSDTKRLLGSLLTVDIERAAKGRGLIPPDQRRGSMHVLIDEFQLFCARDVAQFAGLLSEARKYNIFLWAAHQDWAQIPERLRGALSNVGVEVTFGLDRDDAEYSARKVGRVDPALIKHEVADPEALERTHPVFVAPGEQWESWIQGIRDLPLSEAIVAVRKRQRRHWWTAWRASVRPERPKVAHIQTLAVARPRVAGTDLAEIQRYYLHRYFLPEAQARAQLEKTRARGAGADAGRMEVLDAA